jgi:trehalose utilization protein
MFMRTTLLCVLCLLLPPAFAFAAPSPIRILVWDEQQPAQKQAYDNFLGNAIADYLKAKPGLSVKTARLDDPEQGLSDEALNNTDVLIWWGHVRNRDVKPENAKKVVERIKAGKLSMITLHSAHWSAPFVLAMNERTTADALASLPEAARKTAKLTYIYPRLYTVPKRTDPLTPSVARKNDTSGQVELTIKLPFCVFPAYRADAQPSHVTTLLPNHPIAAGIPKTFDVPQTEMYDEPFHVPAPDAVIFEEKWDKGEHFRSGCLWTIGQGKVFYFRPGHEIYPVYKQELPLKILENAARYLAAELPQ